MIGDTRHPPRTVGASTRWSADEAERQADSNHWIWTSRRSDTQ